jgi:Zn-dependent M28 family amino/carboxypeptidase
MTRLSRPLLPLFLLCALPAMAETLPATPPATAVATIDGDSLLAHIKVLASDAFEGRSPGTVGEQKTIGWLQQQFRALGLQPGNPDGTYLQQVPLASVVSTPTLSYRGADGGPVALAFPQDYVAWASRNEARTTLTASPLVFVGYGVQAPEFRWDDYKGTDLKGKTLVMLINDPPLPLAGDPAKLDPAQFGGDAMTYYGRWTYKYEMAAKLGAAGALIVHETKAAAYPYEVVRNSWGRENFALQADGDNPNFPPLSGWLQLDRAKALFKAGGLDFDTLKQAALSRDFKPVPLQATLNISTENRWKTLLSNNVVAKIEGSDPTLKNEYVLYTAHWDHFGIDTSLPGSRSEQIFHGAQDNASGVAALLEVAKAYRALPKAPKRSILFVITTGEERGLLGAQYYASHPLVPLAKTLLSINVDVMNTWGRTRDVEIVGYGKSDADQLVVRAARAQGRTVRPDTKPESGRVYRSDQFEMAKVGVPEIYLKGGQDYIGKPAGYGDEKAASYTSHDYHKVTDTVRPDWDMAGAAEDAQLIFRIGYDVAQGQSWPQWQDGAEFKATRDASLKQRK